MAINFLNSVDFNKNELLNPTIENQPNDAGAGTGVEGQLYFNTTDDILKVYAGGSWVEVGGGVTSLTTTDGTYIDLTPNSATTGAVTVTAELSAEDGTAAETAPGNGIRYLSKNNKWAEIANIPGTTYDLTGSVSDTTNFAIALDGSDGTLDKVFLKSSTYITLTDGGSNDVTFTHADTSRADTTSTDAPGYGGTFEAVTSVTTNNQGHVTAIDVSTVTIPASDNANDFLTGLSFNTGDGILTATVQNQSDVTVDLDGRFLELAGGTMTGEIDMGSDKITNLLDPTNAQDAATKAYVDNLVDGGLTFKDGFNANTGAIDGGGNLTSGGTRVAISVGDYYVVTTAGDFYGDSSIPLTVGDSVIAKEDAAAGASVVTDWVIIQGDEGVVDLTSGNGGASTGNALTSNTTARGSVTVNSFAYGGTTNVGHVPSGGSDTTFLRGDGTWVTPTDTQPPVDDVTASTTNDLLGISVSPTTGNVVVGLDINGLTATAGPKSPSEMVVWDNLADQNKKITLADLATRLQDFVSRGINIGDGVETSIDITSTDHGLGTDSSDFMIQLVEVSSGETVYADVTRGASGLVTIDFATAPATNAIKVLIQRII